MDKTRIAELITEVFRTCPGNAVESSVALTPAVAGVELFEAPLIGFGAADDPLFDTYQEQHVIGPWHRKPEDWLHGAKTVISMFFPFTEAVRKSERAQRGPETTAQWLHGRIEGQAFLSACLARICERMREDGVRVCAPSIDERFYRVLEGEDMPGFSGVPAAFVSNWSERHAAYVCGLGTFGLSKGLITEKGIAGRFGSIIADLPLEADVRPYTGIYDYCIRCGACVRRCPAQAISLEDGKNHQMCNRRMAQTKIDYAPRYGCGKCQTAVPCESCNPSKRN